MFCYKSFLSLFNLKHFILALRKPFEFWRRFYLFCTVSNDSLFLLLPDISYNAIYIWAVHSLLLHWLFETLNVFIEVDYNKLVVFMFTSLLSHLTHENLWAIISCVTKDVFQRKLIFWLCLICDIILNVT